MSLYAAARVDRALRRVDPLVRLAEELARAARRTHHKLTRRPRGSTRRPGPATPMWNALVHSITPLLRPWGEKSRLARILGVPPQRVHDYFVRRTAAPDAERTLQLMHWLALRREGLNPG
jgi:hypothetical protein